MSTLLEYLRQNDTINFYNHLLSGDVSEMDFYKTLLVVINLNRHKYLQYMISYGIDVKIANSYDNETNNIFLYAFSMPDLITISLLMSLPGIEIDGKIYDNDALYLATEVGEYEICKLLLLNKNFDPYRKNADDESAFDLCLGTDDITMIKIKELYENHIKTVFKVLGQGIEGCVISPSFFGDEDQVTKISASSASLEHEYNIYQGLPDNGPYFNKKDVKLLNIEDGDKITASNICYSVFINYSPDLQLIMPKLKGVTIENVINDFMEKIIDDNTWDEHKLDWYKIVRSISYFSFKLDVLHDKYKFTHGDLNFGNMMYDKNTNDITMYDFGYSFFGDIPYNKYYNRDVDQIDKAMTYFVELLNNSNKMKAELIDKFNLIDDDFVNEPSTFKNHVQNKAVIKIIEFYRKESKKKKSWFNLFN